MRRIRVLAPLIAALALVSAAGATAAGPPPHRIPLPDGFLPEGIAIRHGNNFFVGSIPTGAIYRANAKTGEGAIFVPGREGRSAVGLSIRDRMLYVAGGDTGQAYVYNARSGSDVAFYQLTEEPTFVNDVVATKRAAWFTDSFNPVLYRVPVRRNGTPGDQEDVRTVPLRGVRFQAGFNVNGIDATPSGHKLVIVQSNTGFLFTVDADSGRARRIDLGGKRVRGGDGLLLDGRTLFVVQNTRNRIAVVELDGALRSGKIVRYLRDDDFDVPTTIAQKDGYLYVVNARFSTPLTPETEYWVTVIPKP
jgi:outer membrane protein assembly factor BamB